MEHSLQVLFEVFTNYSYRKSDLKCSSSWKNPLTMQLLHAVIEHKG